MGISYAVVTKVKELAEVKQYGEALDLLDGEDIFQSFNPQFLRCCGEVFMENERFYESREAFVRAHIMAPEGNRIIYDMIRLYLKMGYFQRAKRYYEIYAHNAIVEDAGVLFLQYMILKAQRVEAGELLGILEKACEEQYSDEWGFELALLYASLGMKDKMKEECIHLMASFRNSPYYTLAEALKNEEYDISNSYFRFPIMEAEEDVETYAAILEIEEKQLEKDERKVHPPDPVILQMEDDDGTEEPAQGIKEKVRGIKFPFGKVQGKTEEAQIQGAETETEAQENVVSEGLEPSRETIPVETASEAIQLNEEEDISAYIESVMKAVSDIEKSVAEDLQNPILFQSSEAEKQDLNLIDNSEERIYQSKLFDIEDGLSPKERLEQLMKLIEEDRQADQIKNQDQQPIVEDELDLDEFLMDLVGANTITQAMVKTYRKEKESED